MHLLDLAHIDDLPTEVAVAYIDLFSSANGVMVLRDLAAQTGFMAALPRGADAADLIDHNARRAVFGRLYEILSLTPGGRETLAAALRPDEKETDT